MDLNIEKIFTSENGVKIEEIDSNDLTLNKLCRGCLCSDNLLDMMQTNYHSGKAENYSEMLSYCFSMQVNDIDTNNKINSCQICMKCAVKLREAYEFKSQLEMAQKKFKFMLDSKDHAKKEKDFETNDSDYFQYDYEKYSNHIIENFSGTVSLPNFENVTIKPRLNKRKTKKKRKIKCLHSERTANDLLGNSADMLEESLKSSDTLVDDICKMKNEEIMKIGPTNLPYKLEKTDLQCKICNEVFPLHKSLKIHISVHYPNYVCDICGCVFATELQVYNHAKSHKPATLKCSLCPDIRFKTAGSLKAHTRKKHLGDRNLYRCVDCDLRFCSYNARRRHFVEVHGDDSRKYHCKNCPKRYGLKTHLDSHVRNVHLQVRNYICDTCGDAFFTKIILKNHMAKHTGEKNFHCSLCDKKYARKHTLTEHMKIHNNVKSHICAACGRAFTQKSTLKYHMRVH